MPVVAVAESRIAGNEAFDTMPCQKHLVLVANGSSVDPKGSSSCGIATQWGVATTAHTCVLPSEKVVCTIKADGKYPLQKIEFDYSEGKRLNGEKGDWMFFPYNRKTGAVFTRYTDPEWLKDNKLKHRINAKIDEQSQVIGFAGSAGFDKPVLTSSSTIVRATKSESGDEYLGHGASTDSGFSGCLVVDTRGNWIGMHACAAPPLTFFIPLSAAIWQAMTGGKPSFPSAPSQA
jgi:hypothetical protein